ncbi:cbb3-type cytochrome c oxidase subunit I [Thermomicrobium sp. CFH 73360]|uniref:cbb3-type cytochrome c oxidase subunit I n=1 Tax=Thermomicrobium sp. CFH 73360 TaxID=2951987 RepID=UPI0020777D02|nr:cbb3-type cytochrome c oxidase subunit I [Thermomicrobium sp. CFH 73360]MCM8747371.1 cbb3-type cytochrome c oxidase subunit I [Thermomicrobium sp. CFH 73360]
MSATARPQAFAGQGAIAREGIFLAEQLWPIKGQLVLALLGLAIGGIMGLIQALDRIGIVMYKAMLMQTYYQGLTIHGVLLAFLFTFSFNNAFVSLMAIRGFERPLASTFLVQGAFWTMLVGTLLAAYAILTNQATVLFTFYAPMRASSLFYLGAALLVISTLLTALNLVLTRRAWQREHPGERTPLLGFVGVVTYVMWALATVGVVVLVVFFLLPWSLGWLKTTDPQFNRILFWYTGHPIVYFWLMPAYISWYLLVPRQVGGRVFSDSLVRLAFILLLVFSVPTGLHHQYVDPGIPTVMKVVHLFTTFSVVFPSLVTAFTVMAALEDGGRARGGRGLLGWIWKLPWGDPSVTAQLLAMLVFILGGATGIVNASYNLNNVVHNTSFVPGHFHMTVGTAVALSFIGISYWLIPYLTGRELMGRSLALAQAWLWFVGVLLFARGQIAAGLLGEPRRSSIGEAPYRDLIHAGLDNWLTAIGGTLMVISGLIYFIVVLWTVFGGRRLTQPLGIPVAEMRFGARETSPLLDRLGFWFLIAVVLVAIAYIPLILLYLPLQSVSPPIKVY